jgi:hypothetical protein
MVRSRPFAVPLVVAVTLAGCADAGTTGSTRTAVEDGSTPVAAVPPEHRPAPTRPVSQAAFRTAAERICASGAARIRALPRARAQNFFPVAEAELTIVRSMVGRLDRIMAPPALSRRYGLFMLANERQIWTFDGALESLASRRVTEARRLLVMTGRLGRESDRQARRLRLRACAVDYSPRGKDPVRPGAVGSRQD